MVDIGAFVCSRYNRYRVGEYLSGSIFGIHLATMLADAIMRCSKTKGVIRSIVRFFTVKSLKTFIIGN